MTERVLSTRELNRALLARQLLLERSSLDVPSALEQVGGLQTQYAPSGYIGLWSRLRDFRRDDLTEALVDRRAVQGTLMRSTIHMVSATDYPLFAAGVGRFRWEWWHRQNRMELEGVDLDALVGLVRERLGERPHRQAEIQGLLEAAGYPKSAWTTAAQVINLVRVPPSGTWERRRADLYGLADDWLGESSATEDEGLDHLVRRYLGGFGPAALPDIASWAGVPAATLRPVVERLDLRRFRDEGDRKLVDLPDAPLPDADAPAPVRFIGTWEALLLVHVRRALVLPEIHRPKIFNTKMPQSVPTVLVDGEVAGTWRYDDGIVRVAAFAELPARVRREVDDEAERLAAFHAD